MGNAGAGGGEAADAVRIELHAVGVPDVFAQPAKALGVFGRRHAEALARIGHVVVVFGQVGVQAHVHAGERTRQQGRFAHQVAADRKRRARRQADADHRVAGRIVIAGHDALRIDQDRLLALDQRIGRQSARGLTHAHGSAHRMKPHADRARRLDGVVQPCAIGEQIQVIAGGGAARQQQFGHRGQRGGVHHVGRHPAPDRVQALQPGEELGILHGSDRPGQRLIHVVMGVDQAGHHQTAARVDHLVGPVRRLVGGADRFDHPVTDHQVGIVQFAPRVVEGGKSTGTSDQQRRHAGLSDRRLRVSPGLYASRGGSACPLPGSSVPGGLPACLRPRRRAGVRSLGCR